MFNINKSLAKLKLELEAANMAKNAAAEADESEPAIAKQTEEQKPKSQLLKVRLRLFTTCFFLVAYFV